MTRAACDRADTLHVVLLGAGSASRFGQPKQLADVDGRPMLARSLDTALAFANGRGDAVTVVLGAHSGRLAPLVGATTASMVVNPGFEEGIASSIRTGIGCASPSARGAMILLADQVAVTADDLRRLLARWEEDPARIVAADHGSSYGAPAIFPRDLFPELEKLRGDCGARTLMARHPDRVARVSMPSAAIDVDTPADLGTRMSQKRT